MQLHPNMHSLDYCLRHANVCRAKSCVIQVFMTLFVLARSLLLLASHFPHRALSETNCPTCCCLFFLVSLQDDVPFAASMADHARAIGDKCFKEEQFVAAVHCYEVATLLCPSGLS